MISELYNEVVSVDRLGYVESSSLKKEYTEHISEVDCLIQDLDDAITQDITTGFGKNKKLFCEVCDIRDTDRIKRTIDGTVIEYRIVGIKSYSGYGDDVDHMEIIIRAFNT